MASLQDKCLACGETVVKRARVAASSVSYFLKKYLGVRCQENDLEVDLDAIIAASYVCRPCSKVYSSHQAKDSRLYEATSASLDLLLPHSASCGNSFTPLAPASRKRADLVSEDYLSQCATKRSCSTQESDSPPVVVSISLA